MFLERQLEEPDSVVDVPDDRVRRPIDSCQGRRVAFGDLLDVLFQDLDVDFNSVEAVIHVLVCSSSVFSMALKRSSDIASSGGGE